MYGLSCVYLFFSSRRRHTRCALVAGVQTCALPISSTWTLPSSYQQFARQLARLSVGLSTIHMEQRSRGMRSATRSLEVRSTLMKSMRSFWDAVWGKAPQVRISDALLQYERVCHIPFRVQLRSEEHTSELQSLM